jgi:hypothetical protein
MSQSMTHVLDTSEGWKRLYDIFHAEFGRARIRGEAWNSRLESLGMTVTVYSPWRGTRGPTDPEGTITISNPAGGCVQIPLETATKILTLGFP